MSGEWIKVELATADKPELMRMARILKSDRDAVFGKLIRLWAWFDRNSVDGHVDGVASTDVDALVSQSGFADACVAVGWLRVDASTETIELPNFARHNGETAKKRALKNDRQSRWRQKDDANVDAPPSTPASTREEKRREEKKEAKAAPLAEELPTWLPAPAWQEFQDHRKGIGFPMTPIAKTKMLNKLTAFHAKGIDVVAALDTAIRSGWRDVFEPKDDRRGGTAKPATRRELS